MIIDDDVAFSHSQQHWIQILKADLQDFFIADHRLSGFLSLYSRLLKHPISSPKLRSPFLQDPNLPNCHSCTFLQQLVGEITGSIFLNSPFNSYSSNNRNPFFFFLILKSYMRSNKKLKIDFLKHALKYGNFYTNMLNVLKK